MKTLTTCFFCLLFFCLLAGCSSDRSADLAPLDTAIFKEDKYACNGSRLAQKENLDQIKSKLVGMRDTEISNTLGGADYTELYDRGQRYYVYAIEPGIKCKNNQSPDYLRLKVRINSLGFVSEASYENR